MDEVEKEKERKKGKRRLNGWPEGDEKLNFKLGQSVPAGELPPKRLKADTVSTKMTSGAGHLI